MVFLGVYSCTNRNTPFGPLENKQEFHQITLPTSFIKNTYTHSDSIANYSYTSDFLRRTFGVSAQSTKLVIGNYKGAEIRTLLRFINFSNIPADSLWTSDPKIVMNVNHVHNLNDFSIRVAPIDSVIFYDTTVNWRRFGLFSHQNWKEPGGDFTMANSFIRDIPVKDSLKTIEFSIDKEIVSEWIKRGWSENFGLILMPNNIHDGYIEFHSTNNSSARPQLVVEYRDGTETRTIRRDCSFSAFIHNGQNEKLEDFEKGLFIQNIPPRSIFFEFDEIENYYDLFPGVERKEDLKKLNILQATIEFKVKPETTVMTNKNVHLNTAILYEKPEERQESFDYTKMWHYGRINRELKDEKIELNILGAVQQIISGNRPNNGICVINHQRNLDFSTIELYGLNSEESNRPQVTIKYGVFKPHGE
jgi:hypothetical protein